MSIDAAFLVTWAALPDDLKAALPPRLVPVLASCVLAVGIIGRVVKQKDPDHVPPPA